MRHLFSELTKLDIPFGKNVVITRLEWSQEALGTQGVHILKENSKLIKILLVNEEGSLKVQMMDHKPSLLTVDGIKISPRKIGPNQLYVSKEEILDFVNDVGDENYIHRQSPYIVPGCLLLELILNHFPSLKKPLSIRFYHALYANELLTLDYKEKTIIGRVEDRKVLMVIIDRDIEMR